MYFWRPITNFLQRNQAYDEENFKPKLLLLKIDKDGPYQMPQVTDKCYHIMLYLVHPTITEIRTT
jgi:hypothetical protein